MLQKHRKAEGSGRLRNVRAPSRTVARVLKASTSFDRSPYRRRCLIIASRPPLRSIVPDAQERDQVVTKLDLPPWCTAAAPSGRWRWHHTRLLRWVGTRLLLGPTPRTLPSTSCCCWYLTMVSPFVLLDQTVFNVALTHPLVIFRTTSVPTH